MRLPLLRPLAGCEPDLVDRVEIETPCSVSWDSMYGDDQVRHCGHCRQNVYNVAALSRAEALRLISARERVCLRLYRRPDGTVVTADCWSRLRAARRRGVWAFIAMLLVIGWAELAAIVVGIAGLRRITRQATMGAPRPAQVVPRAELGRAPAPIAVPDDPVIMGEIAHSDLSLISAGHLLGKMKAPPQKSKARAAQHSQSYMLGGIKAR